MDKIPLNRLSKFIEEIKTLSNEAEALCNTWNPNNLETAKILSAKLKSVLSRFTDELNNYFNKCKHHDSVAISDFTTHQLHGESVLSELDTRLKSASEQPSSSQVLSIVNDQTSYSKLPDLTLPVFEGDLLEWNQFWDQFESNINRRKLNDVDKLLYLKSSLRGDAAKLIDGFNTTNKSFEIAVNTLKARYGKEDDIIHAHHRAINDVKKAIVMDDCRSTLDSIERHLRVLQSMGEHTNTKQMKFLIFEKFPADLIFETKMRLTPRGEESVDNIIQQLALIISTKEEARRMAAMSEIIPSDNSQSRYTIETLHTADHVQKDPTHSSNVKTFKNKFTNRQHMDNKQRKGFGKRKNEFKENLNTAKKNKFPCIFCKGDHYNEDCENVKDLEERKAKIKGRCFLCFRLGHRMNNCNFKKTCSNCQRFGVHNRALCPQGNKIKEDKDE